MKNWVKYSTVAFLTSILLVSTLGISINTVYCFCTKTTHVSLLETEHTCLQQHPDDPELAAYIAKMPPCCQKAMAKSCTKSEKDCTHKTKKILKADLRFVVEKWTGLSLTDMAFEPIFYVGLPWSFEAQPFFTPIKIEAPDRAPPPKSGRALLNFIQIYRC